jgi:predicted RNase H-related nuclease YkuK (DUF458 family)
MYARLLIYERENLVVMQLAILSNFQMIIDKGCSYHVYFGCPSFLYKTDIIIIIIIIMLRFVGEGKRWRLLPLYIIQAY